MNDKLEASSTARDRRWARGKKYKKETGNRVKMNLIKLVREWTYRVE